MGGRPLALRRRKQELPSLQRAVKRRVTQPAMPLAMMLPNLLSVEAVAAVARLTGREEVGTFIPFERVPVLHRACSTLKPQYIGDLDELVGRVAMVLKPEASANARRLSELLEMSAVISAPLVVGEQAIGAITVIGAGLHESDLPAVMTFANQTAAAIETARLLQDSREMEEAMVLTLAGAIELREALRSRT